MTTGNKIKKYENNPFLIAINGINTFFDKAKGVAILLVVFSVLAALANNMPGSPRDGNDMQLPVHAVNEWIVFGSIFSIVLLAALFIGCMISGIGAYTAARIARGHDVSLNEAFHAVLERFFSFIWLQIILFVKTLLWTLLLIVPGIIMANRYSLASIAFFDKKLEGNEAIKESIHLTNGAWITTFAAQVLFNIITIGVINEFVSSGARAILYRQFVEVKGEKPAAHSLSWFTLFLPLIIAVLFVSIFLSIVMISFGFKALAG